MGAFEIALILGLVILLCAVMYLASKVQKLHRRARHLRKLVQKLEGVKDDQKPIMEGDDMGG